MATMNHFDACHCRIDPPLGFFARILRPSRERFANAAPAKAPRNMPMFGIVR
jgi:hypothetical protein